MRFFGRTKGPTTPAEGLRRRTRLLLCVLSGILLGAAFPPSPLGALACVALVPLLIVLADIDRLRPALGWIYIAMLVFHLITLNWTGGYAHGKDPYMMIAGGVTMTVHPLFYFLPMGAYMVVKRRLGPRVALAALPALWVGYEYTHSLSEWSFPWLTLGNTQTHDLARIQMAEFTGVWGISLWILVVNALVYWWYSGLASGVWTPGSRGSVFVLASTGIVAVAPMVYGLAVLPAGPAVPERPLQVGIIQPNVDPWRKWEYPVGRAIDLYAGATRMLLDTAAVRPEIVLWPETALPDYILTESRMPVRRRLQDRIDSMGVAVLSGLQHAVLYPDSTQAPPSAKRMRGGERYDAFNAAAFFQPGVQEVPWYGKMKMVPLAERVPYADLFHRFDFLRWGVGIGGWQIGRDTVVFTHRRSGARFSTAICYESVYPGFVAAFVRKGAQLLTIITIDSWWARMSGAFQHKQFAVLRAVENRRWVARCAVGGVSGVIDPWGRYLHTTELFTARAFSVAVGRSDALTFYTRHGDWLGDLLLAVCGVVLAAAAGSGFLRRHRRMQDES